MNERGKKKKKTSFLFEERDQGQEVFYDVRWNLLMAFYICFIFNMLQFTVNETLGK